MAVAVVMVAVVEGRRKRRRRRGGRQDGKLRRKSLVKQTFTQLNNFYSNHTKTVSRCGKAARCICIVQHARMQASLFFGKWVLNCCFHVAYDGLELNPRKKTVRLAIFCYPPG